MQPAAAQVDADAAVKEQLQQLLGVATDDIQQCMTSMTNRLEVAIHAAADRGPHRSVMLAPVPVPGPVPALIMPSDGSAVVEVS